ncbi:response regulator transcription factor [Paenibacillus tritici]|uniref:LytR/AlgR family response regulator transcription factor n=1 Tax=Paenibacillus tritici TaxID=1873425 RepID=UPI001BA762BB|nr:LytTR family DNA-binding domain-containing protein [Paenibacillus tritici]QUL55968.1 response regulator transcription factor [Paenibacillus tritici]
MSFLRDKLYNEGILAEVEKTMIHIAVCDDEPRAAGEAERLIMESGESLDEHIEISLYYSGESFARALRDGRCFDIILMDIELGGLDGITAGQLLREDDGNDPVQLIYISSHEEYHMQLFDLRPSGFIKKPVEPESFRQKLAGAIHKTIRTRQQGRTNFLAVQLKNQELRIPHREILYLESSIRRITLVARDSTLQYYGKLALEEQKLAASHFVRIHQSYIVNFYSIKAISAKKIILITGCELPVSDKYSHALRKAYLRFRGELA